MDKSELFIKQCDCPEVQKYRKKQKDYQVGDYIANFHLGEHSKAILLDVIIFEQHDEIRHPQLAVWLPMQHQIQGMCKKVQLYYSLKNIQLFQVKHTIGMGIVSWEQLWLAFYMHEKHSKPWNPKEERWAKK